MKKAHIQENHFSGSVTCSLNEFINVETSLYEM